MRVAREAGGKGIGGYPMGLWGALNFSCENCGAERAEKCRSWKVVKGERQYIQRYRKTPHEARLESARRARGCDLPAEPVT